MSAAHPKPEAVAMGPLMSAMLGGITGAIEISCTYPTEYTKTVMQLYTDQNAKGAVNVIRDTVKTNGFLGLYRGYSALLMFSVPKNQVRFGAFEYAKGNLFTEKNRTSSFLSGICAGACEAILVVTPQETLKTRLIHDKLSTEPKFKNVFHGIYSIASEHGPRGLYKGVAATLMKQSSNQAVRFVVFEDTNKSLSQYITIKWLCNLISGGFAGFCSTMANNPVDVIKTKMQGMDAHKYNGTVDCAKQILAADGVMGFYKGVGPRVVRVVADVGLTFSIFHSLKRNVAQMMGYKTT